MLYLLDASALFDAKDSYYAFDLVPGFWDWLHEEAAIGHLKTPRAIYGEMRGATDAFGTWIRDVDVANALILDEAPNGDHIATVLEKGYQGVESEIEVSVCIIDATLIAHCLADPDSRCVVTHETSKPSKRRSNRKVPDAAFDVGVQTKGLVEVIRELGFRA